MSIKQRSLCQLAIAYKNAKMGNPFRVAVIDSVPEAYTYRLSAESILLYFIRPPATIDIAHLIFAD